MSAVPGVAGLAKLHEARGPVLDPRCGVGEALVKVLRVNGWLERLDLDSNYIGDRAAVDIGSALVVNKSLKTLGLREGSPAAD